MYYLTDFYIMESFIQTPSFENLPQAIADLHVKVDRLAEELHRITESLADRKSVPDILTVNDVSAMLCKSVSTIYSMTSEHRIPYRKQGNKLYFLREEIVDWLEKAVVTDDASKHSHTRKQSPATNAEDEKSEVQNVVEDTENQTPSVDEIRVTKTEPSTTVDGTVCDSVTSESQHTFYSIDKRVHTNTGEDLYAVNFSSEIVPDEEKKFNREAQKFSGYWSGFGKRGYIFKTRDDAEKFARLIIGQLC